MRRFGWWAAEPSWFLSPTTVRNYLFNAIAKVGGRNRIDTIEIARRAGWL